MLLESPQPRPAAAVWRVKTAPTDTVAGWLPALREFVALASTDTSRDAELTAFAAAAVAAVEAYAGLTVFETVFTGAFPAFAPQMLLLRRPFKAVTGITYVADGTGEILVPASNLYHVIEGSQRCATVYLGDGLAWPDTARRANAVEIDVRAGWALADVPAEIRHAVFLTVASLDHNRGECGGGSGGSAASSVYAMKNASGAQVLPLAAQALLARWRTIGLWAV